MASTRSLRPGKREPRPVRPVRRLRPAAAGAPAAALIAAVIALVAASCACAQQHEQKQVRKIVATGAQAEIDESKHLVLLTGGAKLTTDEGTISSREIRARLGEGDSIETAEAEGDVKLDLRYTTKEEVARQMQATADRAIYNTTERTVQLIGRVIAKLQEPARQRTLDISADEVTFWIDESRLLIRPADLVFTEAVAGKPETETAPAPAETKK